MKSNMIFFLGGMDAEMVQVEKALATANAEFVNKNLGWGAHTSSYAEEIAEAAKLGKKIVLVELDNQPHEATQWSPEKVPVALPEGSVVVDHHGDRSGEPASILQVLTLLGVTPSRMDMLIAANDSGFIPAMLAMGASAEEVAQVRFIDRAAQGITSEQEVEAEVSLTARVICGRLTTVTLPHSKCATVTDRLHTGAGGAGYDQLLILSGDGEVNFYGDGAICSALQEKFQGWSGGSGLGMVGGSAYWGGYPNHTEVLSFIKESL